MNSCLVSQTTNAVVAAGMFAIVAACKSRIRNPAVLHLLWVLVLLKLLTPPLWSPQITLLAAVEPDAGESAVAAPSRDTKESLPSSPQIANQPGTQPFGAVNPEDFLESEGRNRVSDSDSRRVDNRRRVVPVGVSPLLSVAVVWGTGSLLWWGLAGWRISRFQRCLRFAREASAEIQQTTELLAEQLGLRRCPRVWQVPGRVSPMLWAFVGPARVVVPTELFTDLDGPSREALLLHELAHYRRGDQWIRWFELVALGLYWWNPIAWLLRREIRAAEEGACDAWVVSQRPDDRRAYAEMLVTTVGFLSSQVQPPVATGVATKTNIERRLMMIMGIAIDVRISFWAKVVFCVLGLILLPFAPTVVRAQRELPSASSAFRALTALPGEAEKRRLTGDQATKIAGRLWDGWATERQKMRSGRVHIKGKQVFYKPIKVEQNKTEPDEIRSEHNVDALVVFDWPAGSVKHRIDWGEWSMKGVWLLAPDKIVQWNDQGSTGVVARASGN